MDPRNVDDLLALIEAGSVSGAAERRHVTQPAFSRRLRAIEGQLGFAVADRARKPAGPSPALLRFEAELRGLSIALGQLRRRMADSGDDGRLLRVGAVHALGASVLPAAFARLEEALPFAQIRMRSGNRDECFSLLMTGQIDLMLAYESPVRPLPLDPAITEMIALRSDPLVPIIGAAHAGATRAKLDDGEPLPVIAYPEGGFLGDVLRLAILGAEPGRYRPRAISAFTPGVVEMARHGVGVAWAPEPLVAAALDDGRLTKLTPQLPVWPLSLVMLRARGAQSGFARSAWTALAAALSPR